jgi:hypothetical protein
MFSTLKYHQTKQVWFAPISEWNDFILFNSFLYSLKKSRVINIHITVVAPRKAFSLITEADEFITVDLKAEEDYPAILEIIRPPKRLRLGDLEFYTSQRNSLTLWKAAISFLGSNRTLFSNAGVYFFENEFKIYQLPPAHVYKHTFLGLKGLIRGDRRIRPSFETYQNTLKRMISSGIQLPRQHGQSFLVLTRNQKHKAPAENTLSLIPYFPGIIKELISTGIQVINVGFPPLPLPNCTKCGEYIEINSTLTQEELVSLMYMVDGVLLSGRSGGFAAHVLSDVDMFFIHPEWSMQNTDINVSVFSDRRDFYTDVVSEDLSDYFRNGTSSVSNIINALQKVRSVRALKFSPFVREILVS